MRDVLARRRGTGVRELGYRLSGSSRPVPATTAAGRTRRINFVTAHDGFTLRDLVSLRRTSTTRPTARTTATATDDNRSWNCGVEGETDDPAIDALRAPAGPQPARHPAAVDRRADARSPATRCGRTQGGNNNAYCQDNDGVLGGLATLDSRRRQELLALDRALLVALRRDAPGASGSAAFFAGRPVGDGRRARTWRGSAPTARELTDAEWFDARRCARSACTWTATGSGTAARAASGWSTTVFLLVLHAGADGHRVRAARAAVGERRTRSWSTPPYPDGLPPAAAARPAAGLDLPLTDRSAVLLRAVRTPLVGAPPLPPAPTEPPPGPPPEPADPA